MSFSYSENRNSHMRYQIYDNNRWDHIPIAEFFYERDAKMYCRYRNSNKGHNDHSDSLEVVEKDRSWSRSSVTPVASS